MRPTAWLAVLCCWIGMGLIQFADRRAHAQSEPTIQGKTPAGWSRVLESKSVADRLEAINALMQFGPEGKVAIPALLAVFRDREATLLHPFAAIALSRIGPTAVPALNTALGDSSEEVRGGAAVALGMVGADARSATAALATALKDRVEIVRTAAAVALGRIGPAARGATRALRTALSDPSPAVRVEAAASLWLVAEDAAGVSALIDGVKQPDLIRRAAEVLGEMGQAARASQKALREALQQPGIPGRLAAAVALCRVGGDVEAALDAVTRLVDSEELEDRLAAIAALGNIPSPTATQRLLPLLQARQPRVRREAAASLTTPTADRSAAREALQLGLEDNDLGVRWWCALALAGERSVPRRLEETVLRIFRAVLFVPANGERNTRQVFCAIEATDREVPALLRVLQQGSERLRLEALRTLAQTGLDARLARPALLLALADADVHMRRQAAQALATLGVEVLGEVLGLLESPDARRREGAARTLARMGLLGRQGARRLTELLRDDDAGVRWHAAYALWRIDSLGEQAAGLLARTLDQPDLPDRWEVAEALAELSLEARPPIRGMTELLLNAVKDREVAVRMHAARGLWRRVRQGKLVVPLIREGVTDNNLEARLTAVGTLGEMIEEERVLPLLLTALDDREATVRLAVEEALAQGGKAALAPLTNVLTGKNSKHRQAATRALALLGKPALESLCELVTDVDPVVRQAAIHGLYRSSPDDPETVTTLLSTLTALRQADPAAKARWTRQREELLRKLK